MTYICDLEISIEPQKERDKWWVRMHNTPYGYIYGYAGTLTEALQRFDYNYVMAKEKAERKFEQ